MAPLAPAGAPAPDGEKPKAGNEPDRKIRYTAAVEVVVKELDAANREVDRIVAAAGGYVARSEVAGAGESRRTARWSVKVPADKYRPTVNALAALGSVLRNSSESEDTTEEFVDLTARVKNLRVEEDALNKLLQKEAGGKLEDVLKMRDHILKTRGEIERVEGRLKFLAAVTSFSTINLTLQEIKDYKPPVVPTFGEDVSRTFSDSVNALLQFGQAVAIAGVAVAPWLPLIVPVFLVARWAVRRMPPARPAVPDPPLPPIVAASPPPEPPPADLRDRNDG